MGVPGIGRRQKAAAQRRLDGSRPREHHHTQPVPVEGEPAAPRRLTPLERAHWRQLVEVLRERKQLTKDSGQWLFVTVQAYANLIGWRLEAATAERVYLKQTELGSEPRAHPAHTQLRAAERQYAWILSQGGLTPASLARVVLPPPAEVADDPFDAFQKRGGIRAVK